MVGIHIMWIESSPVMLYDR